MRNWDLITIVALTFTATFTPYEVAVLETALDAAFVINRFIDAIFVWDMGMQFFLMYRSDGASSSWVRNRAAIRRHYLKGWFTIDLVSILPFDIVAFVLQDGALGKMKALRIIRLMRLLKLVRIMRASRIFQRWETDISVSYSMLSLCKFLLMIVIVGHWLACAWALLHETVCDKACTVQRGPEVTWLTAWLQLRPADYNPTPHERYTLSMYWSIMTLTSIGYGDIVAQTTSEYAIATFFMLIGAICWAYIIGSTCGIVASLDVNTLQFRQTMDHLNEFMEESYVPKPLRKELRTYFHQAKSLQQYRSGQALMEEMSPMLRGKMAMVTFGKLVEGMFQGQLFTHSEPEFLVEVAQQFDCAVFAPNEFLDGSDVLYHIVRGVVVLGGRVLSNGAMWGDDIMLACEAYKNTHAAIALTYVEVTTLSKNDLEAATWCFPLAAKALRLAVVRLAVSRGLRYEAMQRLAGLAGDDQAGGAALPKFVAKQGPARRRSSAKSSTSSPQRERIARPLGGAAGALSRSPRRSGAVTTDPPVRVHEATGWAGAETCAAPGTTTNADGGGEGSTREAIADIRASLRELTSTLAAVAARVGVSSDDKAQAATTNAQQQHAGAEAASTARAVRAASDSGRSRFSKRAASPAAAPLAPSAMGEQATGAAEVDDGADGSRVCV
jgi:potassium voltage-gated channel Eag-related subfamily H protein 7